MATIVEHRHTWTKRAARPYCRECKVDQQEWILHWFSRLDPTTATIQRIRYEMILDEMIAEG